jgi:hypothetical protein
MRFHRLCSIFALVALSWALSATPATARRTVIDASYIMGLSGYCSPGAAALDGCPAQTLPFTLAIGGQTYNSYWVNSNGTLSLGSIEAELAAQSTYIDPNVPNTGPSGPVYTGPAPYTSLSSYSVPIFSPNFVDGPGYASDFFPPFEFDGTFVSQTTATPTSLSIIWYTCQSPLTCGQTTIDYISNSPGDQFLEDQIMSAGFTALGCPCNPYPGDAAVRAAGVQVLAAGYTAQIFGLTLTQLGGGFVLDYSYGSAWAGTTGTYGFNLPTSFFEMTGPLTNQRFVFDANGNLASGVPEPATWAMMLLGFGLAGFALRRQRRVVAGAG